jgi:hypothetical protein
MGGQDACDDRTEVPDELVDPLELLTEPDRSPTLPASRPKPTPGGSAGGSTGATESGHGHQSQVGLSLAVVLVGLFMSVLDTNIVNVASSCMQNEYGASITDIVAGGRALSDLPGAPSLGHPHAHKALSIGRRHFLGGPGHARLGWCSSATERPQCGRAGQRGRFQGFFG